MRRHMLRYAANTGNHACACSKTITILMIEVGDVFLFGETSRRYNTDLELEVNEDDIEELIMGHVDELTTEELQEILNEEHLLNKRKTKEDHADICH
ncbi:hypothetical protein TNCV_1976281 [Trichonephila clavipes]|nr:hypothetical protein TNCV_1976281 [Trichonephila clavipes]